MFLEPVWLARKVFPDGGVARIESYGSDPVGGHCWCPLWCRARVRVRGVVADGGWGSAVPLFAGRVAASVFDSSGRMFRLSRGCDAGFGAIFWAQGGVHRKRPDAGGRRDDGLMGGEAWG